MKIIIGLFYVFLMLLIIFNFKFYIRKILIVTLIYVVTFLILFKYNVMMETIWNVISTCWGYLISKGLNSNYYLGMNFGIILIGVLFLIVLLQRERRKREPYKKEGWGHFKEYIFRDGILSILVSLLIIILGMVGAGYVNIQNAVIHDSIELIRFTLSGSVGIVIILLGLGIVSPLVDFRFRYGFLNKYENNNAQFIYNLRNRCENIKNNNLGIISFQLFELTKTTSEKNIVYEIDEVWRNDSKYDKISKLKPNQIEVPMEIINLFNRDTIKEINIDQLNKFTSKKFLSKLTKSVIYVPAPYLRAVYDFLFELYYKENNTGESFSFRELNDLKEDSQIVKDFKKWIKDWKVSKRFFSKKNRYKSVHYINFFEIKDYIHIAFKGNEDINNPYVINNENDLGVLFENIQSSIQNSNIAKKRDFLKSIKTLKGRYHKDILKIDEQQKADEKDLASCILLRNYKGGKSQKENRGYYNLCIETENESEGKRRFVLLLIANTRMINEQIALNMFKNVLKLGTPK
ncbi:hypothetical protein V2H29_00615 [Lysinibacillus fusiformis]|uniref:hypothetical protein n=1 Tax=Lysinibacillus fusiformis TaxID=28031 RepID=UPI002EA47F65|nr:hypothetical protein [Lysinibacillus fusiformis]